MRPRSQRLMFLDLVSASQGSRTVEQNDQCHRCRRVCFSSMRHPSDDSSRFLCSGISSYSYSIETSSTRFVSIPIFPDNLIQLRLRHKQQARGECHGNPAGDRDLMRARRYTSGHSLSKMRFVLQRPFEQLGGFSCNVPEHGERYGLQIWRPVTFE